MRIKKLLLSFVFLSIFIFATSCTNSTNIQLEDISLSESKGVLLEEIDISSCKRCASGYLDPTTYFKSVEDFNEYISKDRVNKKYANSEIVDVFGNSFFCSEDGKLTYIGLTGMSKFNNLGESKIYGKDRYQTLTGINTGILTNILAYLGDNLDIIASDQKDIKFFDYKELNLEPVVLEALSASASYELLDSYYSEDNDTYNVEFGVKRAGQPLVTVEIANKKSVKTNRFKILGIFLDD